MNLIGVEACWSAECSASRKAVVLKYQATWLLKLLPVHAIGNRFTKSRALHQTLAPRLLLYGRPETLTFWFKYA